MSQSHLLPDEAEIARAQAQVTEEAREGEQTFATLVASASGAVVSVEVFQTKRGPQLHVVATGNGRRMQPLIFDRFQMAALLGAMEGARQTAINGAADPF
jgi:hypothetical protein